MSETFMKANQSNDRKLSVFKSFCKVGKYH